jgi:sigma-B regulation protein RsbU (phosphoserine phosphatase)
MNRNFLAFIAVFLVLSGCQKVPLADVDDQALVVQELDLFAAQLASSFPADSNELKSLLAEYVSTHPAVFFGATVAVLNANGQVEYSPYVYRPNGKDIVHSNGLMDSTYQINEQAWLRDPIDQGISVWTEPYFDEGGGNIWMQTRAVPIILGGVVRAVATTDVRVKRP